MSEWRWRQIRAEPVLEHEPGDIGTEARLDEHVAQVGDIAVVQQPDPGEHATGDEQPDQVALPGLGGSVWPVLGTEQVPVVPDDVPAQLVERFLCRERVCRKGLPGAWPVT